jgi:hypothetical protein
MKIKTTAFEFEHHYSELAGNSTLGYYIYHEATAYNSIIIDGVEHTACYQTGNISLFYFCPSNDLQLTDYSTSELLYLIDSIYQNDFENDLEDIQETVEAIQELCPGLDTVDKIYEVWEVLRDNVPQLSDYIDFNIYTDNLDDYNEDEEGRLTPKFID